MKTLFLLFILNATHLSAQIVNPQTELNLYLKCIEGGVFTNQGVVFKNTNDGSVSKAISDANGIVKILLSCGNTYEYIIQNFSEKQFITIPIQRLSMMKSTMTYSKNDGAFAEKYKMTNQQLKDLENNVKALPDTINTDKNYKYNLVQNQNFSSLVITLFDMHKKPLQSETIIISGRKYKKSFKGISNSNGTAKFILPKGDLYDISFNYDKNFEVKEINAILGLEDATIQINYIGSKEIERIKKENELLVIEEKKRFAKQEKENEEFLKTRLENIKKELKDAKEGKGTFSEGNVVSIVFDRNKQWKDKLIVCDIVTPCMHEYAAQLVIWYKLNYLKEPNTQFTFFNTANQSTFKSNQKGNTSGRVYYSKCKNMDSLINLAGTVQSLHMANTWAQNNIEALIDATKKASSYKEVIMIVDTDAPIQDIDLLEKLNSGIPVKIILGSSRSYINPTHLYLAWKTKGSLHTKDEDYVNIWKMTDGQEITINKLTYKLMKNRFVTIN